MNDVEFMASEKEIGPTPAERSASDIGLIMTVLETALLTAQEPMTLAELRQLFPQELGTETLRRLLDNIRAAWTDRGVELINVASGWRFRAKPQMQPFLDRLNPQRPPKYSRAVLETLAIIAYRQPVSRGDIEGIRGVTVSSHIMKLLESRGWIEVIGHREVPGRPQLYATTRQFLDDLALRSIEELPPLDDLGALLENGTVELSLDANAPVTQISAAVDSRSLDGASSGQADAVPSRTNTAAAESVVTPTAEETTLGAATDADHEQTDEGKEGAG